MSEPRRPVLIGCRQTHYSDDELAQLCDINPAGIVVFPGATFAGPEPLRDVIHQLRDALDFPEIPVFIDEEGGGYKQLPDGSLGPRYGVTRLPPPHWPNRHSAGDIAALYYEAPEAGLAAAQALAKGIAEDLHLVSSEINWVVCGPVLDIASAETFAKVSSVVRDLSGSDKHETTSDFMSRCFGIDPGAVIDLGAAFIAELKAADIAPCIKHLPGMGDAPLDPHFDMAVVDKPLAELKAWEFQPFTALACEVDYAMTSHMLYPHIDAGNTATLSAAVIHHIRETIGFKGTLVTDAIDMAGVWPAGFELSQSDGKVPAAKPGTIESVTRGALQAGCDLVLYSGVNNLLSAEMALELKACA